MSIMEQAVIRVEGLRKRFQHTVALEAVSFQVFRGELFGLLGPNGAGKTTTINLLIGLARPDSGSIRISEIDCTKNPKAAQHLLGVVPDESNLYPELTGFENLCFCGALYGLRRRDRSERARQLLQRFGLADVAHRPFESYSRGMKRRLTVAAGIIHRPAILFLDEPTTGIDVASARRIRQHLAELRSAGTTIFLTTHYIEEAERLCDRIAFIVAGRIVRIDSVENLMHDTSGQHILEIAMEHGPSDLCERLTAAFSELRFLQVSPSTIRVCSARPVRVAPIVRFLEEQNVEVTEVRKVRPTLEEVFVRITGIEPVAMRTEKERAGRNI